MTTRADQVVTRPQLPLPDIIQCHAGLSLEASYRGCRVRRRRPSRVSNDRRPSSNNNEQADHIQENGPANDENDGDDDDDEDEEELNSDWTVELKLLVGPWRQAGIELRAIADRYQLEVRKFHSFSLFYLPSFLPSRKFLPSLPATTSLTL